VRRPHQGQERRDTLATDDILYRLDRIGKRLGEISGKIGKPYEPSRFFTSL
jgi:hypothetical protein